MTAAAVLIRREKDAVEAFRAAGAITASRARPPEALGVTHQVALRRLTARAVLRPGELPGTLYLDEPSWAALRGMRRRMAAVMLVIVLALAYSAWYASMHVARP